MAPAAVTAAPRSAELRWASVLFVDLVDYTSLTQTWDAADVREMLAGYYEAARTVVHRYGGVVEKFIGDAVVAVWGSQAAQEDDAERCVRAGLDILDAVIVYGSGRGLPDLSARGGVVTGQVASWGGAEGGGLVAGDRVNTAARVQSVAAPRGLLVDDVTMRATRATVAYSTAGEHQLKGIAEPMQLWTAVRVVAGVGGAQRVDGLEAAFVGRHHELSLIKELFHATAESGRARLVAVTGQAGIGKTRLSWEFEKYLDGLASTVFWHRGRCPSYGDGVAFWALAEMVRSRLKIAEDDPPAVATTKLSAGLRRWVTDAEEQAFVEPRLAVLVGATDREFAREELFAAWRLFFERLADVQTVVLLVEDLHWADKGLFDFLAYLLDWSATRPLFVLTFARPEISERGARLFADRRNLTTLHLDPLPANDISELLEDLVPGMPQQVKNRIAAQSAGVPLYAVETVRALIDRDLVIPHEGVYRLVGEVGDLEVPASLTSLIAARLDELPAAERDLVKGLAVLGTSFPRSAVAAVTDAVSDDVDMALQRLVRKEVLTVRADPLSPERGQYEFVQSMLRTVAHDMLSRRERKIRHLAVAAQLRATFPDDGAEIAEVLAAHYFDALSAGQDDPDADEVQNLAVDAFERAGSRAGALGSVEAARRYYLRAAELATDENDELRLLELAARMNQLLGRLDEALELYQRAAEGYRKAGRIVAKARLGGQIGYLLFRTGRGAEAASSMERAIAVLAAHEATEGEAEVRAELSMFLADMGRPNEAADHAELALELAASQQSPHVLARALNAKGMLLQTRQRVVEAAALFGAIAEVASIHDLPSQESLGRSNLADLRSQCDLPGAEAEHEASLRLAERLGDVVKQAIALNNLAFHHFYLGQWERSEHYARRGVSELPEDWQPFGRYPLTLLLTARGHVPDARLQFSGLACWTNSDDAQDRTAFLVAEAAVAFSENRFEEALAAAASSARDAVQTLGLTSESFRLAWPLALESALLSEEPDLARSLLAIVAQAPPGHVPPYLHAQMSRYTALTDVAARADASTVEAHLRSAVDELRRLGYLYWLARAKADLATWLRSQGRNAEAENHLRDAVRTLTELGAQPDLDRLGANASLTV